MDFEQVYKNGYNELREKLPQDSRAFLSGFRHAYDEIENFMSNTDCYESISEDVSPTLAKIDRELRGNVINDLRHWLRSEWYGIAISLIDEARDADVIKTEWSTPEPLSEKRVREGDEDE